MPYIKKENRYKFKLLEAPLTEGELNYCITQMCQNYIEAQHFVAPLDKMRRGYAVINDIIGALECAKLEFYRRIASPYEDYKIKENGDVFLPFSA